MTKDDAAAELRRFLLDGLPVVGALAEAPRYGIVDLMLPEPMAAALDGRTFLHLSLSPEAAAADRTAEYLSYGSPLLDRLLALARDPMASARWYVRGLQHPPKDLRAEAQRQMSFSNAWISAKSGAEAIAYHYAALFWFRATILSHERRERLVPVAIDLHSHRPLAPQTLLLASLDTEGDPFIPTAPFWGAAPDLATAVTQAQEQAAGQVEQDLAADLSAAAERSARRLEAAHSRLSSFYDDMAHNLELRIRRADEDKKDGLRAKLEAVAAERGKKLAEASEQHRVRLVLHLVAAALVARPMPTTTITVENRYSSATVPIAWDTLSKGLDAPVCEVCQAPGSVLHLCGNGHLVCPADIIRCSACKREYCRKCGMGECAVDHAPLCSHSQVVCSTCGKIVCQEHQGMCHRPATSPEPAPPLPKPAAVDAKRKPKAAKPRDKAAQPVAFQLTIWERMRWNLHAGFARQRQEERISARHRATPPEIIDAIRQARTVPQLEQLLDGLREDAWDLWAEQVARRGEETLDLMESMTRSSHPANRTVGAMIISHYSPQLIPAVMPGIGRLPAELQATIAVGLGCSQAARTVPAVGETLWRLASKLYRDINQRQADACWAMILALNDLDDGRRDEALLMGLTRVGVVHMPHLWSVLAARRSPRVVEALANFAVKQIGTDLEAPAIAALHVLADVQGEDALAVLDPTPMGKVLRKAMERPDSGLAYAFTRGRNLLVPPDW